MCSGEQEVVVVRTLAVQVDISGTIYSWEMIAGSFKTNVEHRGRAGGSIYRVKLKQRPNGQFRDFSCCEAVTLKKETSSHTGNEKIKLITLSHKD